VQNVPKPAEEQYILALASLKERRAADGIKSLEKAIEIFPDYFDARFALAHQLILDKKFTPAIAQLDEARRINPKDDRVFEAFGMVLSGQGKFAVAARVFAEAANLNPRNLNYLVLEATALIDEASQIDPNKSVTSREERDYALNEAQGLLDKAYQLSGKKLATVHLQMARIHEKRGDPSAAATELEQYLRQVPNDKKAEQIRSAITQLRTSATKKN